MWWNFVARIGDEITRGSSTIASGSPSPSATLIPTLIQSNPPCRS